MSRVEELRATLKKVLAVVHDEQVVSAIEDVVDSLIAAAEAQGEAKGRAEGAEGERMRIWMARHTLGDGDPALPNEAVALIPVRAFRGVSDPALAPATEEGK